MTLGVMFLVFFISDGLKNRFMKIVSVYGRVPFFYFVIHLYLVHSLMIAIMFFRDFIGMIFRLTCSNMGRAGSGSGIRLTAVYLVWLAVVVFLFPLCKWFGNYKFNNKEKWWLRYL